MVQIIAQTFTLLIGLSFKDKSGSSVLALTPVEILWIIIVTSGSTAIGLGIQIGDPDIMRRPPRDVLSPLLHC